jgi:hypothetical protein
MKRDCIFCRGALSHRNDALKSDACPAAYAAKLQRQRRRWAIRDWKLFEDEKMRRDRNRREARLRG